MLSFNVRGENIEVTDAIRSYVEKKISKLEKYFDDSATATAHVNLKVYSDKTAKVEVTIPLPYLVLRAEETSPDMYGSVDLVTDKLRERGIKGMELTVPEAEALPEESMQVVRTKRVSLKPMDSEEAILQMNMLGHEFFIFEDSETNGTSIVYKRQDGRYGLIETDE